ncbi:MULTISPECIES: hypothetical protein [unclassified Burkholderia]|uniref:hypothetical protein n=1 Tax=unclassified Burkholderia TaxID=2613784 RepID=UPI000F580B2B|nr:MULTISPECIES: hypothetical protein [unclassified Burkholderia]RQR42645.1 hypothetical protein DIE20_13665 [Burkholderia sp. Bp9131]RQR74702.1 hypothetical protein DIE12_10790 [Burkholderia sp. Bp9015]RQR95076.1 hypothetical protein DIE04_18350 [Burkholderia sp. Bp8994]RQS20072.1 hypothetical protein DIE05_33945 [Burkholderia sp. Bp8995]RQS33107.1 hypothetical protein DIE01_30735 [Burkholderia sp. Bp8990]
MSSSLRLVAGKLTAMRFLERPDREDAARHQMPPVDPEARKKSLGYRFTHYVVPIAAALTGNGAAANALVVQQADEDLALASLNAAADKVEHPATWSYANIRGSKTFASENAYVTVGKNGRILFAKLPVEIEIGGDTYRGFLGGQCFDVGDDVVAVVDRRGRLLALSSPDRRHMVMDHTCGDTGLAGLTHTLWLAWKWMFIGMTCFLIPLMLLGIWTSDSGFSDPTLVVLTLLGGPFALGVMLALLIGVRLAWADWLPAWRVSRILTALGRPDLCTRDFGDALDDAERTGRLRDTDVGRIYYA